VFKELGLFVHSSTITRVAAVRVGFLSNCVEESMKDTIHRSL
jgi:hypothetical protein